MKNRLPSPLARNPRSVPTLADALLAFASEWSVEHLLTDREVLLALALVLGRAIGTVARSRHRNLGQFLGTLTEHVRHAAVAEHGRPSFTIH